MIIKPIGLFAFYSWAVLIRIPLYLVIAPTEIALLCLLLRQRSVQRITGYCMKGKPMNYDQAIEYIHNVSWTFCKPGLERIGALCEKLGNPQRRLKYIHVAGTNGKGSFCAMTESILRAAGYKTGLYTSPYILEFNERIRVSGENIPAEDLARITERVRVFADEMEDKPTEFELITAIAFEYFAECRCDVVVLETGLGGRLDSTNIIETSLLSVITGIDLDHTAILGDTVEKIAAEKAGIIKHACPILFGGAGGEDAERVIRKAAEEQSAPYTKTDLSKLSVTSCSLSGTSLSFGAHRDLTLPLLGTYQPKNLANALSAIDLLTARGAISVTEEQIRLGLASVRWPARFEVISTDPVIIFDGSHNPQGIASAAESIRRYFPDRRINLLTGVMADKQYDGMIVTLAPLANRVFTVTPNNPRALNSHRYADCFRAHGVEADGFDTVTDGLSAAIRYSKETDTPLVCLGSLYLYGELMDAMKNINGL